MIQSITTFLKLNQNGIIVGVIAGVIVALIPFLFRELYNYIKICSSDITGWWEQRIYNVGDDMYKGIIIKTDYYKLKHISSRNSRHLVVNVKGKIRRQKPNPGREWDVYGYLDGYILTMVYQSRNLSQKSRGCIYVELFQNLSGPEFRGFYLEEHDDGLIDKTPLILKKVTDTQTIQELKKNRW